jgi:hypothetical protein
MRGYSRGTAAFEGFYFGREDQGRDMISSCAMPSNKKKAPSSERDYSVGDCVKVNLHTGRIVDATVKAIIERIGKPPLPTFVLRLEEACTEWARRLQHGHRKP